MVHNLRNARAKVFLPRLEQDFGTDLQGVEMVRQILQKLRLRANRRVADARADHSVLVKDSKQIDDMWLRNLVHEFNFKAI